MAQEEIGPTWRFVAVGAITLLLTLIGYIVGDFVSDIRDRVADIERTLESRSDMASRLQTIERVQSEYSTRLRTVEEDHWRQDRAQYHNNKQGG